MLIQKWLNTQLSQEITNLRLLKCINHKILISNESQKNNKICINIINNKVSIYRKKLLPLNSHYFIVQDNEFNQWLKNKLTFEEVLGTRRFRYERNPNKYDVKVNSIYTNFL